MRVRFDLSVDNFLMNKSVFEETLKIWPVTSFFADLPSFPVDDQDPDQDCVDGARSPQECYGLALIRLMVKGEIRSRIPA
jgi:hypothetical protein